ncbi:hypothetical protein HOY80DRAFT_358817 [Tuber brumale]|nr:hypothetical protein HOY80DRAFT_358817 [Tuber brumale]
MKSFFVYRYPHPIHSFIHPFTTTVSSMLFFATHILAQRKVLANNSFRLFDFPFSGSFLCFPLLRFPFSLSLSLSLSLSMGDKREK